MSKALLVLNIGDFLANNSRQSYKAACLRWECDYVEVTEVQPPHHPASLKLKAFELCAHDRIFVLDADTVIRSDAPSLFDITDPKHFYAVKNQQPHYPPSYQLPNVQIADRDIRAVAETHQLTLDIETLSREFFNSGACMVSREHHKEVYTKAFEYFSTVPGLQWWDQIPLNVAVETMLGGYQRLEVEWNYQFPKNFGRMTQYIYHFAGDPGRYETLKHVNWRVETYTS